MERTTSIQSIASRITSLQGDIDGMRESQSWQALVAATRLVCNLEKEHDALVAEAQTDFDPTSIEEIVESILELPDEVFEHRDVQLRCRRCR